MSKTINKLEKESIPNFDVPKPIVIFSAYFLGNASKRLSTEITTLVSRYYPQVRLRIVYKSLDRIGDRFKIKGSPFNCVERSTKLANGKRPKGTINWGASAEAHNMTR